MNPSEDGLTLLPHWQEPLWRGVKTLIHAGDSAGLLDVWRNPDLSEAQQGLLVRTLEYIDRRHCDELLMPFLQQMAKYQGKHSRTRDLKAKAILNQLRHQGEGADVTDPEVLAQAQFFECPDVLWRPGQLQQDPDLVPEERGCYGWYFNVVPSEIPTQSFIYKDGWSLLYVGIAGKAEDSARTLRSRILDLHLGQASEMSTLRFSLGYLLRDELHIGPNGQRSRKMALFGDDGEEHLTQWMVSHARVAWVVDQAPGDVETALLQQYGRILPLNILGNRANEFGPILRERRTAFRKLLLG